MINETLYHRTVDILVQAYFNDTLEHGNCCACAVGNIVAANKGIKLERVEESILFDAHDTELSRWYSAIHILGGVNEVAANDPLVAEQIKVTGYSAIEVTKIENAFEWAKYGEDENDYMWNGLMAVIDILDTIHQNTNSKITKSVKEKFEKNLCQPTPTTLTLS